MIDVFYMSSTRWWLLYDSCYCIVALFRDAPLAASEDKRRVDDEIAIKWINE